MSSQAQKPNAKCTVSDTVSPSEKKCVSLEMEIVQPDKKSSKCCTGSSCSSTIKNDKQKENEMNEKNNASSKCCSSTSCKEVAHDTNNNIINDTKSTSTPSTKENNVTMSSSKCCSGSSGSASLSSSSSSSATMEKDILKEKTSSNCCSRESNCTDAIESRKSTCNEVKKLCTGSSCSSLTEQDKQIVNENQGTTSQCCSSTSCKEVARDKNDNNTAMKKENITPSKCCSSESKCTDTVKSKNLDGCSPSSATILASLIQEACCNLCRDTTECCKQACCLVKCCLELLHETKIRLNLEKSKEKSLSIDMHSSTVEHEVRIHVDGMDCTDCATTIERHCRDKFQSSIITMTLSVMTNEAVIRYQPEYIQFEQFVTTITNLGYPSTLIMDTPISKSDVLSIYTGRIHIDFLADCSSIISRHCSSQYSSLTDFNIDTSANTLSVTYHSSSQFDIQQLIESITQLGHSCKLISVDKIVDTTYKTQQNQQSQFVLLRLQIQSKQEINNTTLTKLFQDKPMDGIKSVAVAKSTSSSFVLVDVYFDPNVLSPRQVVDGVNSIASSLSYTASLAPIDNSGSSNSAESTVTAAWWQRFFISFWLCIPVVFNSYLTPDNTINETVSEIFESPKINQASIASFISFFCTTPILFYTGWPLFTSSYRSIRFRKTLNMDCLVALSSSIAYFYSVVILIINLSGTSTEERDTFETTAILICLISLGRWIEARTKSKASSSLQHLMSMQATTASLMTNWSNDTASSSSSSCSSSSSSGCSSKCGSSSSSQVVPVTNKVDESKCEEIDIRLLSRGDVVKVVAGSKIPSDGVVVYGDGEVDESSMSGESMTVAKTIGSNVYGATINQTGVLYVRITKLSSENMLSKIAELVQRAQSDKTEVQLIADRIASWFVPFIVVLALAIFFMWFGILHRGVVTLPSHYSPATFALQFCLSVLVVSCPCAIGLAVAPAVMVCTSIATKYGILMKGGSDIEVINSLTDIVFDKTGTLTRGKPVVNQAIILHYSKEEKQVMDKEISEEDIRSFWYYVASCESSSEHVLGRSLVDHGRTILSTSFPLVKPEKFQNIAGKGVRGIVDEQQIAIGSLSFVVDDETKVDSVFRERIEKMREGGKIVVWVSRNRVLYGAIIISDAVREEAAAVVASLQNEHHLRVWLMSGDSAATTQAVAAQLGIPSSQVIGQCLPADKAKRVQDILNDRNRIVCMVGDGINDSPALATASVGISIASGTDVAQQTAGVVLLNNNLHGIITVIDLSRFTFKMIRTNFIWAFAYNVIAILFAGGAFYSLGDVRLPPGFAGIAELASSLPVLLFALHINKFKPKFKYTNQ